MIEINGENWTILMVSPYHPALEYANGEFTLGSCDDYLKTIFVNNSLDDNYTWKVLCHELTHAAMFSYNIFLTPQQEELFADLIATYGQEIIYITNLLFSRLKEERGRVY